MSGLSAGISPRTALSLPRILAFALPAIPAAALGALMAQFVPRFYAQHPGLSFLAVGAAISGARALDTFVELPLGWLMDHTRTPIGRYRPWYLIGVPILVLAVYMLLINTSHLTIPYIVTWYLVFSFGSSIMTLAHGAWAATLVTDYHQRSRVFGWLTSVAVIGALALLSLPITTGGAIQPGRGSSIAIIGWVIVILTPILAAFAATVSTEPRTRDVDRAPTESGLDATLQAAWSAVKDFWNMIARPTALRLVLGDLFLTLGPALTAPIYLFFFHDVKHFSVGAATVLLIFYYGAPFVGGPLWARVAKRLGKHQTLQLGTVLYAITQTALMALPAGTFLPHAVGMFCVGLSNACFALMIRAMLADYADQLRLEQGVQRVSLLFSFVGVTLKLGNSLNVGITFAILNYVGYQAGEGARNTSQAILGLEMTYLFAPIVFVIMGGLFFFGYKLTEQRHREIRDALDERDASEEAARAINSAVA